MTNFLSRPTYRQEVQFFLISKCNMLPKYVSDRLFSFDDDLMFQELTVLDLVLCCTTKNLGSK